ncbi:HIT domain-containing protein [Patescibacteria group bacterium]|nr:HIT domain-containing protein [Patescibacteria group bacterium]
MYCFLDINPANKGHILIVPKTHIATIFDAEDQILASIIRATKKMALIVKKVL